MIKYVLMALLSFLSLAAKANDETKQLNNSIITKLASSYEFASNPGLYEIISKKTGNTVYLYIDRAGNVVITSHTAARK